MKRALLIMVVMFLLLQIIQIEKTNPPLQAHLQLQAPNDIQEIFKKACYDCHSNQTQWPWYSNIAPFSWVIARHVKHGRSALDFTAWHGYDEQTKDKKLKAIYRTVYGSMPLPAYETFHDKAQLSKEQREAVRTWTGARPF